MMFDLNLNLPNDKCIDNNFKDLNQAKCSGACISTNWWVELIRWPYNLRVMEHGIWFPTNSTFKLELFVKNESKISNWKPAA